MIKYKAKKKVNINKKKAKKSISKNNQNIIKTIIKVFLIICLMYGFYYINNSYSNTISLLAVSENQNGEIVSGSVIDLNLEIKPGTGKTFVNLNTIGETDTQISIINSRKIACNLFDLDCANYDFYYTFEGSTLILKGPSASSAIAILTTKTMKNEKIDPSIVITGSLNSGGIIGNVGGVDKKIEVAFNNGFSKVLIPEFSLYNSTNSQLFNIEVIPIIDIIDAYNNFNSQNYEFKTPNINNSKYLKVMQELGEQMCLRNKNLESQINFNLIDKNSSLNKFRIQAEKSLNSSIIAKNNLNFYSMGSFCYNANINYRLIVNSQKNISQEELNTQITKFKSKLNFKYVELKSSTYLNNINTINDFYTYLIIMDRVEEAREFLKDYPKKDKIIEIINLTQEINNIKNSSITNMNDSINTTNSSQEKEKEISNDGEIAYAYAQERYFTVSVWEDFISHDGNLISFNNDDIQDACLKINREISIKNELMDVYGLSFFNKDINKQMKFSNPFANHYICIYKGLELNGKINTVLNALGVTETIQGNYTQKIINIAQSRLSINSNNNFPLIPYIYLEYANDLFNQGDYSSAMLYSNYALSYADLNLLLDETIINKSKSHEMMFELFNMSFLSIVFIGSVFVLIGFI